MSRSTVVPSTRAAGANHRSDWFVAIASAVLVIGFPTAFWLLILEFSLPLIGFEYGSVERASVAAGLGTILALFWAFMRGSAHSEPSYSSAD